MHAAAVPITLAYVMLVRGPVPSLPPLRSESNTRICCYHPRVYYRGFVFLVLVLSLLTFKHGPYSRLFELTSGSVDVDSPPLRLLAERRVLLGQWYRPGCLVTPLQAH